MVIRFPSKKYRTLNQKNKRRQNQPTLMQQNIQIKNPNDYIKFLEIDEVKKLDLKEQDKFWKWIERVIKSFESKGLRVGFKEVLRFLESIGINKTRILFFEILRSAEFLKKEFLGRCLHALIFRGFDGEEYRERIRVMMEFLKFLEMNNVDYVVANEFLHSKFMYLINFDFITSGLEPYIPRIASILSKPFWRERMSDFEENIKKSQNKHIKISKIILDSTNLVYYKGNLYRNFSREKLLMWQDLLAHDLSVEPILSVEENPSQELLKKVDPQNEEIIVKSGIVGKSLNDLRLFNLPKMVRFKIVLQIIDIATNMWKLGYCHNHMHSGNWTVIFEKGVPKVYLIDFNMITKLDARRLDKEFGNLEEFLSILFEDGPPLRFLYSHLDKKYKEVRLKKK